jgi:hypothetical protein
MTIKVNYTAHVYAPGGHAPLTAMAVGQVFDMAIAVRDLRPSGTYTYRGLTRPLVRGVYAAYCDVLYDKTRARLFGLSSQLPTPTEFFLAFTFGPQFTLSQLAFDGTDRINELGAAAGATTGGGTTAVELARVRMQTRKAGPLTFTPDINQLPHPLCDTLLYGNIAATPPEDQFRIEPEFIELTPATINVG